MSDYIKIIKTNKKNIQFDIRHRSVIDSFPVYDPVRTVLDVGCGHAAVPRELSAMGFTVDAIDIEEKSSWSEPTGVNFIQDDFMVSNKIKNEYDVVMCCEVLEHLTNYKEFFNKLISLAKHRLIITVPWERSYDMPGDPPIGHCNFWSDQETGSFKSIDEFLDFAEPYSVSISKILTKPRDVSMKQKDYLIIIDKRQTHG
tara:strand:+ start:14251 stop:14850 length:600 start_codon:yes stop_codon:yes gene_type:complete